MKNNNDNLTTIIEINSKKEGENIKSNNNNSNINNKSNIRPEIFGQITHRDLLLFKEDFLQTIKQIKTELNTKMSDKYEAFTKLINESNSKLYNFEVDKNRFIQKLNFLEEKNEILSKISDTTNNLKNDLNLHLLHIQNCQKDISNMGFKYDKIITSNLMIPGLIGPMCPFNNLSEYILKNKEILSDLNSNIQMNGDELRLTKKKLDELNNNYQSFKKTMEPTYQSYVDLKIEQLNKKIEYNFDSILEKINSARVENLAYIKNFLEKEKNLDEYIIKMEEIQKMTLENNTKTIEKTKSLNNYTISQLEKNINESINVKKSVLELANIFNKQKRIYGDDNLNENKREVILNFSNMITNLIKDLVNSKKLMAKNFAPLKITNEYEDNLIYKNNNIKEYIDANTNININKNNVRKGLRKLTHRENNLFSNNRLFNYINENNKENKEYKENKENKENIDIKENKDNKEIKEYEINSKTILINNLVNVNNSNNNLSSSSQKKINDNSNKSNKSNFNDVKNNNDNILRFSYNLQKEKNTNLYINNQKKEKDNINSSNKAIISIKNNDKPQQYINSNNIYNIDEPRQSIKEEENNENKNVLSNLKDINNYISLPKRKSRFNINIQKETINSSNTDRVMSRNSKINNLRNITSKIDNSKEKKMMLYTERKSDNSKEKIGSILAESPQPKTMYANANKEKIKKIQLLDSSSQSNNILQKGSKIKEIINNKIKKRPFSKVEKEDNENNIKTNNVNDIYTSIGKTKNTGVNYIINRSKEKNKEIYYNKNIEANLNYIKDKDIIDRPLLSNHNNFEVLKERGGLEKKILELEYFTKKKFDELVKEIKNFIPIHFNSYLKDYTVLEIDNKKKNRK